MKVLEVEAKMLLREQGLPVPNGQVIGSVEAAAHLMPELATPLIIKAQVPIGGRMKAGGIRFAETPSAVEEAARALLGTTLRGFPVEQLLIEERVNIRREIFCALTYDSRLRSAVLLVSAEGGIEIEEKSQTDAHQTEAQQVEAHQVEAQLRSWPFSLYDLSTEHLGYLGREAGTALGFSGRVLLTFTSLIEQLIRCFIEWDALLLEINPLILDSQGQWWVADVHLELDDDAAWRQQALLNRLVLSSGIINHRSAFEQQAIAIDSADHRGVAGRLVPLGGTLGLLIGGGGASLTILDAVLDAGLEPANYCEVGGNPSVWKIKELTKLILSQPGVQRIAVIMNVVSNTRVDLMARGVIKGVLELGLVPREVIAVFRIPGSWESEGQAVLNYYGVPYLGREVSIDQVITALRCT